MSVIALPAFHVTTTKRYTIECPYSLQQDLEAYKAFYKRCYNADVTEPDLIREMIRSFMDKDPEFRRFKTESGKGRSRSRGRESDGVKKVNGSSVTGPVGSSSSER